MIVDRKPSGGSSAGSDYRRRWDITDYAHHIVILDLLEYRAKEKTTRLDDAIRYLTERECSHESTDTSWVESADIDRLYDLSQLRDAKMVVGCGKFHSRFNRISCGELPKQRGFCPDQVRMDREDANLR